MRIYLDNCCYNRLFDDRTNIKNYLEREAILIVMQKAYDKELIIVGSDILKLEMSKIKDNEKRNDVEGVYNTIITDTIKLSDEIIKKATEIRNLSNIKAFDSLHLASSEMGADILLTTDIKFLRNSKKINLNVAVKNPVDFVMEVFNHDESDNKPGETQ